MRISITGAAGRIGRCLVPGLGDLGHDVRGIDLIRPDEPWADRVVVADIGTDDGALDGVVAGADAVVHLAANAGETDFATALTSHVVLTHRVLEAARAHGVGRVVYASSNHAVGFTPRGSDRCRRHARSARTRSTASARRPPRRCAACTTTATASPSPACASAASATRPAPAASCRRGCRRATPCASSTPACGRPTSVSPPCTGSPTTRRAWWDLGPARELGYQPADDAEAFAAEIEAAPPTEADELDARYVGGNFARITE